MLSLLKSKKIEDTQALNKKGVQCSNWSLLTNYLKLKNRRTLRNLVLKPSK